MTTIAKAKRCKDCLNFQRKVFNTDDGLYIGECRANPPGGRVLSDFPTVQQEDWCAWYHTTPVVKKPIVKKEPTP